MPNRMAPLDSSNKLIGIANNTERTTWGGIAHRTDDGAFLAVQERRSSNSSGAPRRTLTLPWTCCPPSCRSVPGPRMRPARFLPWCEAGLGCNSHLRRSSDPDAATLRAAAVFLPAEGLSCGAQTFSLVPLTLLMMRFWLTSA